MRKLMQKLNVVKYALSESQEEELLKQGFKPAKPLSEESKKEDKDRGQEEEREAAGSVRRQKKAVRNSGDEND